MRISLRLAVGGMSALSVAVVCVIVLATVTVLNRQFGESLGRSQAQILGELARAPTEAFFNVPARAVRVAQRLVKDPRLALPMNTSSVQASPAAEWLVEWERLLMTPMIHSNYALLVTLAALRDGSFFRCRIYDEKIINHMYSPSHGHEHPHQIYVSNMSDVPLELEYPYKFRDIPAQTFPLYNESLGVLGTNETTNAYWRRAAVAVFPTEAIRVVSGKLLTNDGTFLGYYGVVTPFVQVSEFLRSVVSRVAGSSAFVISDQGDVIATSFKDRPYTSSSYATAPSKDTLPAGCVPPNPADPSHTVVCMQNAESFPEFPLLGDVFLRYRARVHLSATAQEVEQYFVYAAKLDNEIEERFDLNLFLFYPKQTVLGGFEKTLSLAIGISVAVAILAALLTGLFISLLLKPLGVLSRQIRRTANLQDDNDDIRRSRMVEVDELAKAYAEMKAQLVKVKRFVPPSLFMRGGLEDTGGHGQDSSASSSAAASSTECKSDISSQIDSSVLGSPPEENQALFSPPALPLVPACGDAPQQPENPLDATTSRISIEFPPRQDETINLQCLEEDQNTFSPRRCTVLSFSAQQLPTDPHQLDPLVKAFMGALSTYFQSDGPGTIDQLTPARTILSFNAHHTCHMHAEKALQCALKVLKHAPSIWIAVIDSCTNYIGTCATSTFSSRVVVGESVSLGARLASLARPLHSRVLLTERAAHTLSHPSLLPVDVIEVPHSSNHGTSQTGASPRLKIYTLLPHPRRRSTELKLWRELFLALSQMDCPKAKSTLDLLPDSRRKTEMMTRLNFCKGKTEYVRRTCPEWEMFGFGEGPLQDFGSHSDAEDSDTGSEVSPKTYIAPAGHMKDLVASQLAVRSQGSSMLSSFVETGASFINSTCIDGPGGCDPDNQDEGHRQTHTAVEAPCEAPLVALLPMLPTPTVEDIPKSIVDVFGEAWLRAETPTYSSAAGGSIGFVFTAVGPKGTFAAVKFIPLSGELDTTIITQELETVSAVQHENIVSYFSCAVCPQHIAFFMEYVAGGSLRDLMRRFGELPISLTRRLLQEVLRGLEFLHSRQIVHCDIKPDNVLVTIDGVAKLADFGSSLLQSAAVSCKEVDQLRGTAAYVAPEVAQGHAPQRASDIWSFGVLMHEVMTDGMLPWGPLGSETMRAQFIQRLARAEEGPLAVPDDIDNDAREIISQCLQRDPRTRPSAQGLLLRGFFV